MALGRKPLVLGVDLAGLLMAAGLAAFAALGVVLPFWSDARELERLRRETPEARQRREKLHLRNQATAQALDALAAALRAEARPSARNTGDFLEHVTEQCRRGGIALSQVQPQPVKAEAAYRSWSVQVRAKGTFPDFQELLRGLETWSPYVQVDDLLVLGPKPGGETACELTWTVRVNFLPEDFWTEKEPARKEPARGAAPRKETP